MNNKGQMGIGLLIMTAITVIVGLILMQGSAVNVGQVINTAEATNVTVTMPAQGVSIDLVGQDIIGDIVIQNGTETVPASNYTVSEIVSLTTGVKTISLRSDGGGYESRSVNTTYTYGPDGYSDNSGARSLTSIILIFFAIAIAVIALVPALRSEVITKFGGIGR